MYTALFVVALIGLAAFGIFNGAILGGTEAFYSPTTSMSDFHNLSSTTLDGQPFSFQDLKGKKVLIVNTASRCGYTPQYKKLQELQVQHGGEEFVILGFPCNQFGRQEPGSAGEISDFCSKNLRGHFSDDVQGGCERGQPGPSLFLALQCCSEWGGRPQSGLEFPQISWSSRGQLARFFEVG